MKKKKYIRTTTCECGYHGEPTIINVPSPEHEWIAKNIIIEQWYCPKCNKHQI